MARASTLVIFTILLIFALNDVVLGRNFESSVRFRSSGMSHNHRYTRTRWAILIAGSHGYENYRHQADVCHAYQVLKKGGLKDENIVVFMYDDIATHINNPRPGIILNHPLGQDVYAWVPKDYTREAANLKNLYAVLLGNKTALVGGSGKVVNSGPNDTIFIFYSDHGGAGVLGMPNKEKLYGKDLIEVLKMKHNAKTYESMAIYVEACESGSLFEGLLPDYLNVYAMTAAKAKEKSFGTYCPDHSHHSEYDTCLADLFSVSWMEDREQHRIHEETLGKQFNLVRQRTAANNVKKLSSHVMEYGTKNLRNKFLSHYIGIIPTHSYDFTNRDSITGSDIISIPNPDQRDADLLHFHIKYLRAPEGSDEKIEAKKKLDYEVSRREYIDRSIRQIYTSVFGNNDNTSDMFKSDRPALLPLVDDWDCFKMMIETYENFCGDLSSYGLQYTRVLANMCNYEVSSDQMIMASKQACVDFSSSVSTQLKS